MGSWIPPAPTRLRLGSRFMSMRTWTGSFRVELQSSVIQAQWPLYADRERTLWSPRASSRPGDGYILPCPPCAWRVPDRSFQRMMTSRPLGAIIFPGRDGGHREIGRASSPTDGGHLGADSPGGLGLISGGPHIFWQPEVWLTTALPAMNDEAPADPIKRGPFHRSVRDHPVWHLAVQVEHARRVDPTGLRLHGIEPDLKALLVAVEHVDDIII